MASTPVQPWEGNNLQNSSQLIRNSNTRLNASYIGSRSAPILPPRPSNSPLISNNGYNSYMPYSGMGYGGYGSYGSSYGSYGMPYRSSLYNSYGSSYGGYNSMGMFGNVHPTFSADDHESWLYKKVLRMMGFKVSSSTAALAWKEAAHGVPPSSTGGSSGSNWPTIAFLGVLVSAPYIISKFLPKYEDKGDPSNWKSPGIRAKAVFDFIASAPNELTVQTNDVIVLAPTYIQEEMNLKNTGWAFAVSKGKSGVVPLNYLVISKNRPGTSIPEETLPVPRPNSSNRSVKTHTKRVSFGENQIFENFDIDDYILPKDPASNQSKTYKDTETHKVVNEESKVNEIKCLEEKETANILDK